MSRFVGLRAVLFDLDGTLVDSAPDLAASANRLRARQGLPPLPLERLRQHCGSGARGMLGEGLGLKPGDPDYEAHRIAFLADYAKHLLDQTLAFEGVAELLAGLQARDIAWGIVTNKTLALAQPLQRALLPAPAVLVGGDCTPHRKPHPASLREALQRLGLAPEHCVYVGDDHRDMLAAQAAGMPGIAAAWGYVGAGESVASWGAALSLERPLQLLQHLQA